MLKVSTCFFPRSKSCASSLLASSTGFVPFTGLSLIPWISRILLRIIGFSLKVQQWKCRADENEKTKQPLFNCPSLFYVKKQRNCRGKSLSAGLFWCWKSWSSMIWHLCCLRMFTKFLQLPFGKCPPFSSPFKPPFTPFLPFLASKGFPPGSRVFELEEPFMAGGVAAFGFAIV